MFNIFRKKPDEISRTTPGFEETERKTSKTGAVLLIIMFIAGTFFGWRALDDMGRIPAEPAPLSYCAYRYESAYLAESFVRPFKPYPLYYPYNEISADCVFNELEKEYGIPALLEKRMPLEKELRLISEDLNSVESSLNQIRYEIQRATGEYGVGLQEKSAQIEKPVFPTEPASQNILDLRQKEATLLGQKSELESKKQTTEVEIAKTDEEIRVAYKPVFEKQNRLLRIYEFKIFLLQFFSIIPFFILIFWGYLRLHRKNSPYAVIFTAMTAVASVLLLRVLLFWFWGLFLERVLEILIRWFNQYQIIRTLMFYAGMLLSFALFGGAAYWLQKKVFDPRRVALRRFRGKQCPHCQADLDLAAFYCPNCGARIREKCEQCGQARFVGLPNCPHCGHKA